MTNTFVQAQKKTFPRFYDAFGYKFEKGYYVGKTDSSIIVHRDSTTLEIPITRIFTVKTRRSVGHNILLSSLIEAIPVTVYAVSTGEPHTNEDTFSGLLHDAVTFTPGEAAILGVFGGMVGGTITGVLLSGKSKILLIDGNMENWNQMTGNIMIYVSYKPVFYKKILFEN